MHAYQELLAIAKEHGACEGYLEEFSKYSSLEEAQKHPDISYAAYWLVKADASLASELIDLVNDSEWAYQWALEIGDQKIMRDRVTNSRWAYWWARNIGDQDVMRDRVTDSNWIIRWERTMEDWCEWSAYMAGA